MYFPLSQIKSNLSTNGGEFMYASTKKEYVGKYYSTSTGKFYTGASPQDGQNAEIIKINIPPSNDVPYSMGEGGSGRSLNELNYNLINLDNPTDQDCDTIIEVPKGADWLTNYPNNVEYSKLTENPKRSVPPLEITRPTPKDVNKGYYTRYFVKDFIKKIYYEISQTSFEGFFTKKFPDDLYEPISFKYYIGLDSGVKNKQQIKFLEASKNWKGFSSLFNFSTSTLNDLYTNGYEFTYLDRTNYIGFYHIMENGRAMTGRFHGDGKDIPLLPLNIQKQTPSSLTSNQNQSNTNQSSFPSSGGGGGY